MGIIVRGKLGLNGEYEVELPMSEKKFNQMSHQEQKDYIENEINWGEYLQNADVTTVDIDEIQEFEGE